MKQATILGAGLVGSLLAVLLRRRGYEVSVYERRPDMRKAAIGAGRSINLAMSHRGWKALELAGLRDKLEPIAIAMPGRALHMPDGASAFQPYGKNGEAIYSVSRGELNKALMTAAEEAGAQIHFEQRITKVDIATNELHFDSEAAPGNSHIRTSAHSHILFGADGAFSALRTAYSTTDRISSSQQYLEHGYKELNIPAGPNGEWMLERGALHIWPRHNYMLIALPNVDGSFTCTLFFPFEGGEASFAALKTGDDVLAFFQKNFPDAVPLMPTLVEDFLNNPTSSLVTTHVSQWHYGAQSMLIGDAAHAIVPFYGQGMNAGFEDCTVLDALMEAHGDDWATIMPAYQAARRPNGDAVAQLALNNFVEMRDKVADPQFLRRKGIEKELGRRYPSHFTSVYEMVSFSHTPYSHALHCIQSQDALLEKIMAKGDFEEACKNERFLSELDEWMVEYAGAVAH